MSTARTTTRTTTRVLSAIAVGLLSAASALVAGTSPAAAETCPAIAVQPYSDVPLGHPFCREIANATGDGWVTGYGDGTFRPTNQITRQAAAAMLWRASNIGAMPSEPKPCEPGNPSAFSDVPQDHPFCGHIRDAALAGVLQGYGDGTFRPGNLMTRQAVAAALVRFQLADFPAVVLAPCIEAPFDDVPIGHPFCEEIQYLSSAGITTGYPDGGFHPGAPVTRQGFVALLQRTLVMPT